MYNHKMVSHKTTRLSRGLIGHGFSLQVELVIASPAESGAKQSRFIF
jgi:hypothetical protein